MIGSHLILAVVSSPYFWIAVLFIISYSYLSKEPWRGLPPGPPRLPLVGSLPFLGADMRKPLKKMAAKYGSVFTLYLGPQRVVVLNGHDAISDAFTKGFIFAGRPGGFYHEKISKGRGLFFNQGPVWREQRQYALHVLRDFGFGRNTLEDRILNELEIFIQSLSRLENVPFDPQELTRKSVANVIFSIVLGKRFEYGDSTLNEFIRLMELIPEVLASSNMAVVFPWLRYLPWDVCGIKKLVNLTNTIFGMHQTFIDQHKEVGQHFDHHSDFIQVYLQKIEEEKSNPDTSFTELQLVVIIHELFAAGLEATSTALLWSIVYMTTHQDVQSRVQAELDDVIGNGDQVKLEHRRLLPYTYMCISEILRISDVTPIGVPHSTTEDTNFKGYFIPKDTWILPNMSHLHTDPEVWSEPHRYDPNRFLDNEGKVTKRKQLMPFSVGKRSCIGESLARMQLFLYFTTMMKKFRFLQAPGYPFPNMEGKLTMVHSTKPFHIIVKRRH